MLVLYLNSMTVDLPWLKGVLETVHAHIHIYIYPGPWRCQMLPTHAFCPFTWLWSLLYGTWDPTAPTSIALSQPLCGLVSGFDFRMLYWVGKMDAWIKSHSRSGSAVSLHTHEPENVRRWLNPRSTDGQTSHKDKFGMYATLWSKRHLAEYVWCNSLPHRTPNPIFCSRKHLLHFCLWETKTRQLSK